MQLRSGANQAVLSPDRNRGLRRRRRPEIFDAGRGNVVNRHTDASSVRNDGFDGRPYDRDVVADAVVRDKAQTVRGMGTGIRVGRRRHVRRSHVWAVRPHRPGHRAPEAVAVPGRHRGEVGRKGSEHAVARIQHVGHRQ